ncbi:MAG: class I SAM-dependent methyltransferase [Burkholderiaceae bacterium]|nr:class I SAM-dependent methyltransferase [Burkholderiaceae bacterium]
MQIALLFIFVVLLIGIAVTFIKVRKVHIIVLEMRDVVSATQKEVASAYTQERWHELLSHRLALHKPLPPTRGWAGSPDFLFEVAKCVANDKPKVVLECSSGVSTLVIARVMQQSGVGHVYSLEHDAQYAERSRQMLRDYGVEDWATVLHAPLIPRPGLSPWYDHSVLPAEVPLVDLLVIDGPPMATARLARYPALPLLKPRLQAAFTILVDDADREDEQEMLRRWQREVDGLHVEHRYCEKGLAVVQPIGKLSP